MYLFKVSVEAFFDDYLNIALGSGLAPIEADILSALASCEGLVLGWHGGEPMTHQTLAIALLKLADSSG